MSWRVEYCKNVSKRVTSQVSLTLWCNVRHHQPFSDVILGCGCCSPRHKQRGQHLWLEREQSRCTAMKRRGWCEAQHGKKPSSVQQQLGEQVRTTQTRLLPQNFVQSRRHHHRGFFSVPTHHGLGNVCLCCFQTSRRSNRLYDFLVCSVCVDAHKNYQCDGA